MATDFMTSNIHSFINGMFSKFLQFTAIKTIVNCGSKLLWAPLLNLKKLLNIMNQLNKNIMNHFFGVLVARKSP